MRITKLIFLSFHDMHVSCLRQVSRKINSEHAYNWSWLLLQENGAVRQCGEWKRAIRAPALRVFTVWAIGRGCDDVSDTPALSVDNGLQIPHDFHLLQKGVNMNLGLRRQRNCCTRHGGK